MFISFLFLSEERRKKRNQRKKKETGATTPLGKFLSKHLVLYNDVCAIISTKTLRPRLRFRDV